MSNVIQAILSGGSVFRTKPVYQYASGMILEFSGADLPDTFEVDFANDQKGASITQIATNNRVTIPDQFFVPGAAIYVYLVDVGKGYAVTRDPVCIIPISPRAMRTNDEPTPSQQSALDEAIAALNGAVESAETAIEHYPQIVDGAWRVWDVDAGAWVDTGVAAQGPQGVQGPPGQDGTDGQDGVPGADGKDGKDGTNGKDGVDGADGYSPTASVSKSGTTATITITDKNGTTTATVSDGTNGTNGQDGADGVSPAVTIASITGGHSVTITDKDHPSGQSFDVMDGSPSDQQVTTAVDAWLDDHPEATTTVEDGAITKAKLDSDLQDTVDDVADLKSAINDLPSPHDSDAENVDLDLTDEDGNVIVRFSDGHIQTKEFNSKIKKDMVKAESSTSDFDITDQRGNVLARFSEGHIKTKNFDSRTVDPDGNAYESDVVVTVGSDGDFSTLNEALLEITKKYPVYAPGGVAVHIKILSGTTINEQIAVQKADFSYVTIIAEDEYVPVNVDGFTSQGFDTHDLRSPNVGAFIGGENAAGLPCVGCVFKVTQNTEDVAVVGYFANRSSRGVVLSDSGFDGFYDGVISNNESSVTIRDGIARNNTRWGVHARHNGEVSARSADLTNNGEIAAYADRVANLDVREADCSGSTAAVVAYHASQICAAGTHCTEGGGNGNGWLIHSQYGSFVDCSGMEIIDPTCAGIFNVAYGGFMNVSGLIHFSNENSSQVFRYTRNTFSGYHGVIMADSDYSA